MVGTFATAACLALLSHYLLGFGWLFAGLVGAAVAPTDPAVMFSVLRGRDIEGRSRTTLEGEAGVNDPAGIALMLGMIELATNPNSSFLVVVREFAVEMSIGAAAGVAAVAVLIPLLRRLQLSSAALYPVLTLVVAAALYGGTSIAGGSGFLAVFIAGLFLARAASGGLAEIKNFHASLASFAELTVFVALGLTVQITDISGRVWLEGSVLALILLLIARPVAVAATLSASGFSRAELLFINWSGLKGAVPILLAAFAVLVGAPGAAHLYAVVFVVVLISVIGQGTLIPTVARKLRIPLSQRPSNPTTRTSATRQPQPPRSSRRPA